MNLYIVVSVVWCCMTKEAMIRIPMGAHRDDHLLVRAALLMVRADDGIVSSSANK